MRDCHRIAESCNCAASQHLACQAGAAESALPFRLRQIPLCFHTRMYIRTHSLLCAACNSTLLCNQVVPVAASSSWTWVPVPHSLSTMVAWLSKL